MKKAVIIFCLNVILTPLFAQTVHHDIRIVLDIAAKSISVKDSIKIPITMLNKDKEVAFRLNGNFIVSTDEHLVTIREMHESKPDVEKKGQVVPKLYVATFKKKTKGDYLLPLEYKGAVKGGITSGPAEYARGFSETSGIISEKGVYLAGSTIWVPEFENVLNSFNLHVEIDSAWGVVSQGKRTINNIMGEKRFTRYESPEPMDEIYLVAAQWTEYQKKAGNVLVQAFLRTPDEKLAYRYIDATGKYIAMYEQLIGPYPFSKFALVENFWETGYGMPSFTLLGEKVIRFPFILYTSYPHELLHNYWGNSVYIDYSEGNWCEGITAYMADHLLKEQQGKGAEYRRTTLQKYTDYASNDSDFPLTEFRSRNNPAQEAVGYGKCLMINHMLRKQYGDEAFIKAYRMFYNEYKFKKAGFSDLRKCFETVTGDTLAYFFGQWVKRTGAPELKLYETRVDSTRDGYNLRMTIGQVQEGEPFNFTLPVAIYLDGENDPVIREVKCAKEKVVYFFRFEKRPLKIEIDPQFDVFRKLDRDEVPTSLSQLFGSEEGVIILPHESPHLEAYRQLAVLWQQSQQAQNKKLDIIFDNELETMPSDRTVWLFGYENKLIDVPVSLDTLVQSLPGEVKATMETLQKSGSLVYTFNNPGDRRFTVGFAGSTLPAAIKALGRKLPHYGKYGYLGFDGDEANNVLKGEFPAGFSPYTVYFPVNGKTPVVTAKLQPSKALIE